MNVKTLVCAIAIVFGAISCDPAPTPLSSSDSMSLSGNKSDPIMMSEGNVMIDASDSVKTTGSVAPIYMWIVDGKVVETSSSGRLTHEFTANGDYKVSVVISDQNNKVGNISLNYDVKVENIGNGSGTNTETQTSSETETETETETDTNTNTNTDTNTQTDYQSLIEQAISAFITNEEGFNFACSLCHYSDNTAAHGNLNFSSSDDSLTVQSAEAGLTTWLENGGLINRTNPIDGNGDVHGIKFSMVEATQTANEQLWTDLIDLMSAALGVDENGLINYAPNAKFTFEQSDLSFSFDASSSSDRNGDTLTYTWDFGDDSASVMGEKVTHTFAADSNFTVKLVAFDGEFSDDISINITTKVELIGDIASGEDLYNEKCFSCHQTEGVGVAGLYEAIPINAYIDKQLDAYAVIEDTMPKNAVGECTTQCAADIEAFMMTWERTYKSVSCDLTDDAIKYGPRQMRLLTVNEYTNTIMDMFGYVVDRGALPADSKVNYFSNQVKTSLDSARLDAFVGMADKIIDDAAANNYENILGYDEGWSGALRYAFRRPATAAEIEAYEALESDGIEYAIRALLTSPYFLFRSELGMTPAEFVEFNENADPIYKPVGTPYSITPESLGLTDGVLDIYSSKQFSYNFQGGEQVQLRATGTVSAGYNDIEVSDSWPLVKIGIQNGDVLFEGRIPPKMTSILVPVTLTGNQTLYVDNGQQNHPQSGSRPLIITGITISEFEQVQFDIPQIDSDAFALTPYEMATFLAYTYTGTMPDAELLTAADSGFTTDAAIEAQIERLLSMDKAKQHIGKFVDQWLLTDNVLTVGKDAVLYSDFNQEVREAMAQEAREIFIDVIFNETGFTSLFNSNYTFVNAALADFYGIGGVSGNDFVKVQSPDRGGILTSGAFLSSWARTDESHLIKRAVKVRERAMCQHMPPFPTDVSLDAVREEQAQVVIDVKAQNPDGKIRQSHLDYINTNVPECLTCHKYMINPLGVGMEDYDAVGLPRTQYANDLSVNYQGHDASIEWHNSALYGIDNIYANDDRREFQGVKELGAVLAAEDVTRACLNEMTFRFVMATGPDEFDHADKSAIVLTDDERTEYSCVIRDMQEAMGQSDNPRDALKQLGLSDIVRFRKERNR
ncbi:DUF1592 domain-containing protein [Marinicellulosiphila megalodicopiae]|uniref:DUF1592 domain-containing protein n=1 Tax=Marinicellulosiphila megalodicopiae TaxID=2724896 RepID=UPI003BAE1F41